MQSIRKSECPKELEPADRRAPVHVNLVRKEGNYPVSPTFHRSFFVTTAPPCFLILPSLSGAREAVCSISGCRKNFRQWVVHQTSIFGVEHNFCFQ